VIGNGQPGQIFIQVAQRMGYRAGPLSETEDMPTTQLGHSTVIGRDTVSRPVNLACPGRVVPLSGFG
jgi:phosphoribosylaminoimidazole carboxylase (NCAIR synthetase)